MNKEQRHSGSFVGLLNSTPHLFVLAVLLVIVALAAQPITDPDFWWHLKTGDIIVQSRSIPHSDIFSTPAYGREWVTHEWLSEIFIFLIFRSLGFAGLISLFAILIAIAFLIRFGRCYEVTHNTYVAGFVMLLGATAPMPTWGVRPQMFSILFASIFLNVLDRFIQDNKTRSLWWLVPLMILWVNVHAGYALGLFLIALAIVGLFLDGLILRKDLIGVIWIRARLLVLLLGGCLAAVAVNPNGLRMYSYPFETITSQAMMKFIQEWHSPDFQSPVFQPFLLFVFLTLAAVALSRKQVRPSELVLLVFTGWLALRSGRNAPFFSLVAMPVFAEHLSQAVKEFQIGRRSRNSDPSASSPGRAAANVLLLGLVLLMVVVGVRTAAAKQSERTAQRFPVAAVDFVSANRPPQPIYNEYAWGGYLIWRLFPDYRVYIDGRADVYGDSLIEEYRQMHDGNSRWREQIENRNIQTVLVKPNTPLASLLRDDRRWRKAFEDAQCVIFIRSN